MQVDLLRHGAATPSKPGSSDGDRPLSDAGEAQVKAVAERAREAGAKPSLILSSPYTRARQTAAIAAKILGYSGAIVEIRSLEPDRSPFDLWDDVRARTEESEILLVGHLPLLGDLASILLGRGIGIPPATIVRIHVPQLVPEPGASLQWVLGPE